MAVLNKLLVVVITGIGEEYTILRVRGLQELMLIVTTSRPAWRRWDEKTRSMIV